jgi:hypothetical protein
MLVIIVALAVASAAWILVSVSTAFQTPQSNFVTLPTDSPSKSGIVAVFSNVSTIMRQNRAVGVKGYLVVGSGSPVAGAKVYVTYYFQASYRTQTAITDDKGYFEIQFPMNWTGWLPITLRYFGDSERRGLVQVTSLYGENLAVRALIH